jgi:23S rRNA (adenine2503-C2)-methyltransferase
VTAAADILSLSYVDLAAVVARLGEKPYRAKQLFRWLHQKYAASFDEMTDLPKAFRTKLAEELTLAPPAIEQVQQSTDGTRKYKLKTTDGRFVEAVYMPDEVSGRRTLCVSSQVGCAMGCTFCLTATMGIVRHMTPGEIIGQVHRVNRDLLDNVGVPGPRPLTNLVFMGMGEPLHNFDNLKAALQTLLSGEGPNFSHRHVTVSTSGLVPAIARLGEETEVKLAISLNATTDEVRDEIMPVNRKWPIEELMAACRKFPLKQGRRITFEYVLLSGINDTDEDAHRLAKLIGTLPAKVNLIPYNENPGLGFKEPTPERVESFRRILDGHRIAAPIRKNRGRDISAACGQLAVSGQGRGRPVRPVGKGNLLPVTLSAAVADASAPTPS